MIKSIAFLGTPEFSIPTLNALHQTFGQIITVISMPDKPKGRGKQLKRSPVSQYAYDHNLPQYQPKTKQELTNCINAIKPDVVIVVAYGMIIEKVLTDAYYCINIHSSILPNYRGASPIHTAILNGDNMTGITLIKMNEKMDEGDIICTKECRIEPNDNLGTLSLKLANLSAPTLITLLEKHSTLSAIPLQPQPHTHATYTKKIMPQDCRILPIDSTELMLKKIRAFGPKPGAYIIRNQHRIKLLEATLIDNQLTLLTVQPEGKPPMPYNDYCLGHPEGITL